MLSRLTLRLSPYRALMQIVGQSNTSAVHEDIRDPTPYFFNERVQELLKILIRPNPEIIFRRRLDSSPIKEPEYKFMTNEELKEAQEKANEKMWKLLQIPPFVKIREDKVRILSKDPAIQGYSDCKHVFTDITYGISNKNRIIVVREPDGTLRTATYAERDRLNQIYFPIPGREIEIPKMFEEEHLQPILDREDYEFILNRACVQFDPDHPEYHRILQKTFDEINIKMKFSRLNSTRHYGSMVFYLAWNKNINNLLLDNIRAQMIEDAALIIQLYYILHKIEMDLKEKSHNNIIEYYLQHNASKDTKLEEAYRISCQLLKEKQMLQKL